MGSDSGEVMRWACGLVRVREAGDRWGRNPGLSCLVVSMAPPKAKDKQPGVGEVRRQRGRPGDPGKSGSMQNAHHSP